MKKGLVSTKLFAVIDFSWGVILTINGKVRAGVCAIVIAGLGSAVICLIMHGRLRHRRHDTFQLLSVRSSAACAVLLLLSRLPWECLGA